jgi:LacI family transcriptional regulator
MAVGAIAASEALGFNAGSDLAIAGYGDYSVGRYSKPPITSMRYDTEKVGEEMAKLMLNKLESTAFEVQNWYKASVVERQSDQVTSPILTN